MSCWDAVSDGMCYITVQNKRIEIEKKSFPNNKCVSKWVEYFWHLIAKFMPIVSDL